MSLRENMSYIIPVLSISFTYFLGVISNKNSRKHEIKLHRYETLYVPFIQKLFKGSLWVVPFHMCGSQVHQEFLDLITDNSHLLGRKTAKLLPTLYSTLLLYHVNKNKIPRPNSENVDAAFRDFCVTLLQEAQILSKSLKYPNLPATILEFYNLQEEQNSQQ